VLLAELAKAAEAGKWDTLAGLGRDPRIPGDDIADALAVGGRIDGRFRWFKRGMVEELAGGSDEDEAVV